MITFNVPRIEEVSQKNQRLLTRLEKGIGFIPNLYATYAYSENALESYLALSQSTSSLTKLQKEAVNLAVSQANGCQYCLAAHTAIAKMNGFTEDQILHLRAGKAPFDSKLEALAALAQNLVVRRGETDQQVLEAFFASGWTRENLVDTILLVGEKTISNYLHQTTKIPVDFPEVQPLEVEFVR